MNKTIRELSQNEYDLENRNYQLENIVSELNIQKATLCDYIMIFEVALSSFLENLKIQNSKDQPSSLCKEVHIQINNNFFQLIDPAKSHDDIKINLEQDYPNIFLKTKNPQIPNLAWEISKIQDKILETESRILEVKQQINKIRESFYQLA